MERFPITSGGLVVLKEELKYLKNVERPSIIEAIAEARALGDLSENAEYHAARERQSFVEGKIMELESRVSRSEVIDVAKLTGKTVKFGATVHLIDEDTDEEITYQIVGEPEADISKNKISYTSPIARAIMGKSQGDSAEVNTPSGIRFYEIGEVKFIAS
jgi:transcription elongation factor GreA